MRVKQFIYMAAVGILLLAGCAGKTGNVENSAIEENSGIAENTGDVENTGTTESIGSEENTGTAESVGSVHNTGITESVKSVGTTAIGTMDMAKTGQTDAQDVKIYYVEPVMTVDQDERTGEDYFDFDWDMEIVGEPIGQFVCDYDNDGNNEICLLMTGARGSGVSVERLFLIEQDTDSKTMKALEFGGNRLWESIKQKLAVQWDANAHQLVVRAAGNKKEVTYSLADETIAVLGIDCFNQIHFEVQNNKIWMDIDIGLCVGENMPSRFLADEESRLRFEVTYTGSSFQLSE